MKTSSHAADGTRLDGSIPDGLLVLLSAVFVCLGAGAFVPSARGDAQPVAHLDASADIVWVVETTQSPTAGTVTSVSAPQHIEIHAVDVDQTTGVFPAGPDEIQATVRDRTSTSGSIEVGQFGVTLTASDGQITSRYLVVDGGEPGNAPTGPAGQSGFSPTVDYIQDLGASPSVKVRGWVQSGYIRLTDVAPDTPLANLGAPSVAGSAQQRQTLSATAGDWTGTAPTFAYQWKRCNALGEGCVDIAGATGTSLQLGANDVGAKIRVAVTATNGAGSVTAVSVATAVVAAAPSPPSGGGGDSGEGSNSGVATGDSRPSGAADTASAPVGGTATPLPPAVVKPILAKPLTQPLGPTAGRQFTFTLPVNRSDNGGPLRAGRMVCDSTLAGKSITHIESFTGGKAQVWIVVPKTAKGKQLQLKIKIMSGSRTTTRVYTYKVR